MSTLEAPPPPPQPSASASEAGTGPAAVEEAGPTSSIKGTQTVSATTQEKDNSSSNGSTKEGMLCIYFH